jgi:tRNA(Ile)-lysidine synthase
MLNPDLLLENIRSHTFAKKLLISFSGGLDSTVLLHALADTNVQNTFNIRAIHINHGLQPLATDWEKWCIDYCAQLDVPIETISLNLNINSGESIEAMARAGRYQAIAKSLQADEVLLTAHHQDDQAETMLIQLCRGAGIDGLAAMPECTKSANSMHIRPLLNSTRSDLEEYAAHYKLDYIEDPSNLDSRFDRNFFRHHIMPVLKKRWSNISSVIARAAKHQAEAKHLLAEYLEDDLISCSGTRVDTLSINKLKQFSQARSKALIRFQIQKKGFQAPSKKKLEHIISDVLDAQVDATPCVHWAGVEIRRYQDDLYVMASLQAHDTSQIIDWDIQKPLPLLSLNRILKFEDIADINPSLLEQGDNIQVRFRQGGESIYSERRKRTLALKKLFQESHIPPWERDRIPLIYRGDKLIAIAYDKKDVKKSINL